MATVCKTTKMQCNVNTDFVTENKLQWNPVNPTTNGPAKSGRINGVVVLTGENDWENFSSGQKKVVVLTRWSYQRGGRKAGFHCINNCESDDEYNKENASSFLHSLFLHKYWNNNKNDNLKQTGEKLWENSKVYGFTLVLSVENNSANIFNILLYVKCDKINSDNNN